MSSSIQLFITDRRQEKWVETAASLAKTFSERAERYDRENEFPFENFRDLKEAGFHKLTLPRKYGGEEISLTEFVLIQETLATGCASTALGLGWHLGIMMNIRETGAWPEERYRELCQKIAEEGAWINSCSTEPTTGSPSRGRRHRTTAVKSSDGWILNGHKTWSTLSPLLDVFLISAAIDGTDELGEFLVPRHTKGLVVKETWDSVGMRATGSHDVHLSDVRVPHEALLERHPYGQPSAKGKDGGGWMLHIPACYTGVAEAARRFAVHFAKQYHPAGSEHPIASFPSVQDRLGRMETLLYTCRSVLYHAANRWDAFPDEKSALKPYFAAAKYTVTNKAVEIVDLAMRIVGGRSMLKQYPLERYYRDIRGGLHNPPMDDAAIRMMADQALKDTD